MRKLIVAGMVAAALAGVSIPAAARSNVDLFVNIGPPPPVVEVVAAPRVGFVWVPGFWEWRHGRHIWVGGHYIRHRHGFVYEPARWIERDGRWGYVRPGWRVASR
jgi:hypothetical protein